MDTENLVYKGVGADIELGIMAENAGLTQFQAARKILGNVAGIPSHGWPREGGPPPMPDNQEGSLSLDMDRKWLPENGASIYIDSAHPEMAHPICRSADEFVAVHRSLLSIMADALEVTNAHLDKGRIRLFCDNSDGKSNSYGSHIDLLISAQCFRDILDHRGHYLQFIASVFAAGTVLGQGKVGSESGSTVAYQLSQRADFFSRIQSLDTMHLRGLVNSRRENLCGSRRDLERFHIIFFDHNLSPFNQHLKIGILQIILLLMEARMVPFDLILEEPVAACHAWSRDPQLRKKARLVNGKNVTVGEYHLLLLEKIADFENRLGSAALESFVPEYGRIVTNWQHTARAISEGDFDWLSTRLDAYIKKLILENAMEQGGLNWTSPTIAMLDKLYSEIPNGLFFQLEKTGAVERVDSPENLLRFRKSPPNTRAAVRSKLLGLIPPDDIRRIDWDTIIFEAASRRFHIELSNPLMRMEENSQLSRLQSVEQLVTLLDGMPRQISGNDPENHGRVAPDPNEKHQPKSNDAKRKKQQRGRETWNNGSINRSRSPRPPGGKG